MYEFDGMFAGLADGEIVRPKPKKEGLIKKVKLLFFLEVAGSYIDKLPLGSFFSEDGSVCGKTVIDGGEVHVNSDEITTSIDYCQSDYGDLNYLRATRSLHDFELQEVVSREHFAASLEGFRIEEFGSLTVVRALRTAAKTHLIQS